LIAFLCQPLTFVIFRHGLFTATDSIKTAGILALYMLGVPFISALRNLAVVFYAHKDARTPMMAGFATVGINLVLNISLMQFIGVLAFPLSATVAAMANVAILYIRLPRKIGALDSNPLFRFAAGLTFASLSGGAAAWTVSWAIGRILGVSWFGNLSNLVIAGAAGISFFYLIAALLGLEDVKRYARRFLKI
jgi:putative peptidoglycan lipid II flippase